MTLARRVVHGLVRLTLRIFFRRIEVAGLEQVPARGPVLFCPNHPNALVDPALLLATAPRPVSFLAKAPLFRTPVIGTFARALEAIPVYRPQDDTGETRRNVETFAAARALLERGGTIAIFPEGVSHSEPALRPLKTGAARIALGAGTREPVRIVPVALFYPSKSTFRSAALVQFGAPITVPAGDGDPGEPAAPAVAALTAQLADGMRAVLVHADRREALALAGAVERLFLAEGPGSAPAALAESAALRRRILAGYAALERSAPERVGRLRRRIERHEARLKGAGLNPGHLTVREFTRAGVLRYAMRASAWLVVLRPLAVPGIVLHWPAYRLVGALARRVSGEHEDVVATAKALAGLVFFPLTWVAVGVGAGLWLSWPFGVLAAVVAPLLGWAGLLFLERLDHAVGATRALLLWARGRERFLRLQRERAWLRDEVLALARELEGSSEPAAPPPAPAS